MRRLSVILFGVGALTVVGMNVPASAGPVAKATGGIAVNVGGYPLYLSFSAFNGNSPIGQMNYTNFGYRDFSGVSPVWTMGTVAPNGLGVVPAPAVLSFNGSPYFNVDPTPGLPTSNYSIPFTGSGAYLGTDCGGSALTVNMKMWIVGNQIPSVQFSWGPNCSKNFSGSGSIDPDGSMHGSVTDVANLLTWNWSFPAGTAIQVLHFTAPTTCATVSGNTGEFAYTVPMNITGAGAPTVGLVSTVVDNGSPGTLGPDTITQDLDQGSGCSTAPGPASDVLGGNLVVHS